MNKTEIVECIYKHVGRTDDLENLTDMAEEIAMIAANEERDRIVGILHGIDLTETESDSGWWETNTGAKFGAEVLDKIRRSN